jgi:pilus assembly protein Flp/PilA
LVRKESPVIPIGQSTFPRSSADVCVGRNSFQRWFSLEESPVKNFTNQVVRFLKDESGPTAVEYAIMLALIVIVCIGTITTVGNNARARFQTIATTLR